MIDTNKYEGVEEVYLCEELHKGWTDVISKETNQPIARIYCADTVRSHNPTPAHHILMDAFKLYREVKRLRDLHILACDYLQSISNGTLPDSEWPHIHAMIRGDD